MDRLWRAAGRLRIGRTGAPEFAGLFVVGLFMAAIGAFDSDTAPALPRYVYWLTVMLGGGVIGAGIEPVLLRWPVLAARPLWLGVAQALAMTPPITVMVWLVSAVIYRHRLWPSVLPQLLFSVLVVNAGVVVLAWLVRMALRRPPATETLAASAPARTIPAPIAEKLPPRLGRAELLAVQAEDHYLRIHTSGGDDLILLSFGEALEALQGAGANGVRTHRSWWVARQAVDEARFSRGRGELTLSNGVKAPVSRTYAAAIRDERWA